MFTPGALISGWSTRVQRLPSAKSLFIMLSALHTLISIYKVTLAREREFTLRISRVMGLGPLEENEAV